MDTFTTTLSPSWGRRLSGFGLAFILVLGLAACGDDDDSSSDGSGGATETTAGDTETTSGGNTGGQAVEYDVSQISYSDLSAPAGGTIDIVNSSGAAHTFTADDGAFDVDYGADDQATVDVPTEPGEYPFHCEIHSSMHATLTVEG